MDAKYIKALLSKVVPRKSTLKIIQYAYISRGTLTATNLDEYITIDTGLTSLTGFLNVPEFYKTLSIAHSIIPTEQGPQVEDWPDFPGGRLFPVDVNTFPLKWGAYTSYCDDDTERVTLNGLYFNPVLNEIIATDGHTLLAEKTPGKITVPMIVHRRAFPLLDLLKGVTGAQVINENYLSVSAPGVTVITKLIDGPYPDYPRVIPAPKVCQRVPITEATRAALVTACTMLAPYANEKTGLITLQENEAVVYSLDKNAHYRINLGALVTPEVLKHSTGGIERDAAGEVIYQDRNYLGFNQALLSVILKEFTGDVVLEYGKTDVNPLVIRKGPKTALVMPLRVVGNGFDGIEPQYLHREATPTKRAASKSYTFERVLRAFGRCGMDTSTEEARAALRDALDS